ncbi:MAG: cytochrome c oxidase assembly protein [Pseudomonadota bacterium]|nr:cytochrome c oxidase assembly protein [Pseudomonadota bacterium]
MALLPVAPALAHGQSGSALHEAWSLSWWFLLPAGLMVASYLLGLLRVWHRAGVGRGISVAELSAFAAGVVALFLAMVWPLDALGERSLAAHMGQHMLLLAFVPPLLLAGRPLAAMAHALPARWAMALHHWSRRWQRGLARALGAACTAQLAATGLWHLPAATAAALRDDGLHWLMHGSFLAAGLWFWMALWQRVRDPLAGVGPALVAIVAVMMQMGFIGALLTFSRRALYPVYAARAPTLGLEALADQQLAGLIMWVPAGLPYVIGGVWLMQQGLRRAERRQPRVGTPPGPPPDAH